MMLTRPFAVLLTLACIAGVADAALVSTPAVKGDGRKADKSQAHEATSRHVGNLRGQLLYIAQKRMEFIWLARESANTMSKPIVGDLTRCMRAARYLKAM